MKKVKLILLMILILGISITTCFAAYLIIDSKISTNISSVETGKYKVTFTDNDTVVKTMYVDSGYNLSLKDAPYYFKNNQAIKWISNGTIINAFEGNITSNMVFSANTFSSNEIITEALQNGPGWPHGDNNIGDFNDKYKNGYVFNSQMNLYYWTDYWTQPYIKTSSDTGGILQNSDLLNNDNYIGFQVGTNDCNYTLQLNRDIILMGNITVGGRTGFYGNNSSYSQISYQGFIIGNYCTLDLNGHDLIVGDPNDDAMLDVWGQVTDTSINKKGTLVLDSNSTMYAVMPIEDVYHEKRMPYTYYTNDNIFSMYRCPYWTCNTIINSGTNIYGKYMIDLGGNNKNMIKGDIKLFGKTDGLIKLESGYVTRKVSEDTTIKNLGGVYVNDWLYQKINYDIYDATVTFNKFIMPFEYTGLNANMDSTGYDFFISPYYNFRLYNTTLNLNQHLVFMPGSYLYMDERSILNMSYLQEQSMESIGASGITIPTKYWQASAGLTFIDDLYLMNSIKSFFELEDYYHTSGNNKGYENTEGYKCDIFQNRGSFWSNLDPAYGEICGEINFIKQGYTQYNYIQFGGRLYIDKLSEFESSFNIAKTNGINVRLFSSTFKTDWCRIFGFQSTTIKKIYRDVTGYYNYPLVVNDYVLMNPDDPSGKTLMDIKSKSAYKYDFASKTIYNQSEYYAFIFSTTDLSNLAYCNNLNDTNSLDGTYVRVGATIDSKTISLSGKNYILYNGAYIPASGNGYSVTKFIDNSIYANYLNWTFTYSNNKWTQSNPV